MHHEDITPQDFDRFWSKVDQSAGINGCWPIAVFHGKRGYPTFSMRQRLCRANRFAFISIFGDPPPHLPLILHKCPGGSHRWCVNPAHLAPGTVAENAADMIREGRSAVGDRNASRLYPDRVARGDTHYARAQPERLARGEHHGARLHPERWARGDLNGRRLHPDRWPRGAEMPNARLTAEQVREIRRRAVAEPLAVLAREFHVHRSTVRDIVRRKWWKDI